MRRSRQVIRLLGLLKALQDGERLHVAQLAARFHVRRETAYRDLRALEELGFPVVGDLHGVKSRPRLASRSSPKSVSIPFTLSELLALAFAASATEHLAGMPLHDDLKTALAKVQMRFPDGRAVLPWREQRR